MRIERRCGRICLLFFRDAASRICGSEIGARIACERGLIDIDAYGETCASVEGGAWKTFAVQEPIDWAGKGSLDIARLCAYITIIRDLLSSIEDDREPMSSGWDGRQAVATALAAYESSRAGREVVLNGDVGNSGIAGT